MRIHTLTHIRIHMDAHHPLEDHTCAESHTCAYISVDLNADGRMDLLVTNNHGDGTGSVFAYEQPDNYQTSPW